MKPSDSCITLCQVCLRHPDCETAKQNREGVFKLMRGALSMIHHIVMDEGAGQANGHVSPVHNGDSGIGLDNAHSACKAFKEFEVILTFLFRNRTL